MAVDPSIALNVRPVQVPDQMSTLAKVLQLQGAQQGIRLSDLQYQKLTRDIKDEEETKAAYSAYIQDPSGTSLSDLASKNPKLVQEILKQQRERVKDEAQIAKDRADAELKTLEAGSKRAERAANILAGATNQATYELAKSALVQQFGQGAISGLPDQFDAQQIASRVREGMTLKDRLTHEFNDRKLKIDQENKVIDQRIAQQNADSQRMSARASVTSAGAAVSNANTAAGRLALDRDKAGQPEGTAFEVSDRATGTKHLVYRTGSGQLVDANTRKPIDFEAAPKAQDVTPEGAGKVALLTQARQDVEEAKKILFTEKGDLRRITAAGMNVPYTAGVGEEARKAYTRVRNAVAAKLRIETGAAAPVSEVDEIARRFMPSAAMDTSVSARDKLDRLQEFMDMSLRELERSGYAKPGTAGSARGPSAADAEAELRRRGERP